MQDIIGYMARRDVMWDYSHRTALTDAANTGDLEHNQRWTSPNCASVRTIRRGGRRRLNSRRNRPATKSSV